MTAFSLFFVFLLYGPSVGVVGELRYVEIFVLLWATLNINTFAAHFKQTTAIFCSLFMLAAFAHFLSDFWHATEFEASIKRLGSYVILSILACSLMAILQGNAQKLAWLLVGYGLSYAVLVIVGQAPTANYSNQPWRLGLGYAFTMLLCLIPVFKPRLTLLICTLLVGLSIFHFTASARSLAFITISCAFLSWIMCSTGTRKAPRLSCFHYASAVAAVIFVCYGAIGFLKWSTENHYLPDSLQIKMEQQLSSPYGFIAAARADTAASLLAIVKSPLLGHGSKGYDDEVFELYHGIRLSAFENSDLSESFFEQAYMQDWHLGIPSHSHLFGAWADAGILAIPCWVAMLILAARVGLIYAVWKTPWSVLIIFLSAQTVWDIIFSPGPHRMDIAIRLTVFLFAWNWFKAERSSLAKQPLHFNITQVVK